ncbi:hypothetical protein GIB67_023928 [Kingdonia uniflora]|uniref:Uncharacterized protein n=1 Tax=Kingdonia uniflora TaxID=39325 RepID=A0A7J7MVL0_9MAGN|nr:hypothetical protein GIB67_023928 [Kingdonia uniflora]
MFSRFYRLYALFKTLLEQFLIIGVVIQAKVALARIVKFLEAPELQISSVRHKCSTEELEHAIFIKTANLSWDEHSSNPP